MAIPFIGPAIGWVGSAISSLIGLATKLIAVFFAYRAGRKAESRKRAEDANKVKAKQLDIAAGPAPNRRDVLDDLDSGRM